MKKSTIILFVSITLVSILFPSYLFAEGGYASIRYGLLTPLGSTSDHINFSPINLTANIGYEIGNMFGLEFNFHYGYITADSVTKDNCEGYLDYPCSADPDKIFSQDDMYDTNFNLFSFIVGPRVAFRYHELFETYVYGGLGFSIIATASEHKTFMGFDLGTTTIYKPSEYIGIGPFLRYSQIVVKDGEQVSLIVAEDEKVTGNTYSALYLKEGEDIKSLTIGVSLEILLANIVERRANVFSTTRRR